jgi:malonyl-CoA decarboxylase
VEKVAKYESVHRIRTLSDLKNRLSSTRRCYIYTHSTMPNEPLVILHIALTNNVSSSIQSLIKNYSRTTIKDDSSSHSNDEIELFDVGECTNAIFYSINSCQKGLQQVDLGNSLIKSCVRLLIDELPNLKNFHTLSPIPKFKEWLDTRLADEKYNMKKFFYEHELNELQNLLNSDKQDSKFNSKIRENLNHHAFKENIASLNASELTSSINILNNLLAQFLLRSCAFYLYNEKKNGYAFNSVTNFHLRNGAQIYRLNLAADLSDNGWSNSYGMMVNYGYKLNELDSNCIDYLINKNINISDIFRSHLI